ncbi:hypothetical protein ACIQCF_30130 [Streptomyces sp. NPDC088353]|uniref:hypothetical protein n=1 Tax=Streptomyces sp. NPDC088353 TaxID=3365855 RepID=UPI0037F1E01A
MSSHIENEIQARIARVRAEAERKRQERAELAAARTAGLARRHAQRLRNQTHTSEEDAPVKIYRRHNCQARHTTWADLAACIWPAAAISGDGPYAVLACRTQAVALYTGSAQATARKRTSDRDGCTPGCIRRHQVVLLDPTTTQTSEETLMPALRTAVCPACRRERPARLVTTVVVSGAPYDVLRCPDAACELLWLARAERPRTAAA